MITNVELSKDIVADLLCSAIEAGRTYGCGYWAYADEDLSQCPAVLDLDQTPEEEAKAAMKELGSCAQYYNWYCTWALFPGGTIVFVEHNDEDAEPVPVNHTLNLATIQQGLNVMAAKYPHRFASVVADEIDGPLGEEFLQCCFFNELKYG